MKKLIWSIIGIVILITGCMNKNEKNIQEESIVQVSSMEMSVADEESSVIREGIPVLEAVEIEKEPQIFIVDPILYEKEYGEKRKWVRENLNGEVDEIIYNDSSKRVTTIAGIVIEGVEVEEKNISFVTANSRYMVVACENENNMRSLFVYRKENPLQEMSYRLSAEEENNTVQDIVVGEQYLYWSETRLVIEEKPYWKISCMDLNTGVVSTIESSENFITEYTPRLAIDGECLVFALADAGETWQTVYRYDPIMMQWEELYYINCVTNPYSRIGIQEGVISNVDYDGGSWYGMQYNVKSKELMRLKLQLKYDNEIPSKCAWVGEWAIYSTSYGIIYLQNIYTGEIRYLDSSVNSFTGLGDNYVVYTGGMYLCVYDIEQDKYIKVEEINGKKIQAAYFYAQNRDEILIANLEKGASCIIRITEP